MRRHYDHTLLYLHETIDLGRGLGAEFTGAFTDI